MADGNRLLAVEIGPEAHITFGTIHEFETWVAGEQQTWSWLGDPQQVTDKMVRSNVWPNFSNFYGRLQNAISQFASDNSVEQLNSRVQAVFDEFVKTRRVAIANSVHGSRIAAILARYGGLSTTAARERAALAQFHIAATDNPPQINGSYARSAAFGLIAYEAEEGSTRAAEAHMNAFLLEVSNDITARQAALDACQNKYDENLSSWAESIKGAVDDTDTRVNTAIAELQRVKELFEKHMGLQAPVQYWTDKATAHKKLAGNYRNTLLVAGLLSMFICVGSYVIVYLAILNGHIAVQNSVSLALLSFGGLALLTTAALWIARILSRLYLSQHHLGIDAEERATMVTTYLALLNEGAVAEQDRAIVLASLFRPTADGIVKDEAPPVTSPASFLANLVTPSAR